MEDKTHEWYADEHEWYADELEELDDRSDSDDMCDGCRACYLSRTRLSVSALVLDSPED